ncbi:NnrU family protein [Marinovum sp.]|uniref:NnrU family protein n=1 Tax=Marinovum sp. TaxID=2024839 RepID=UPI002B277732|nr:NnrU family protein [Marinovum sp.]
MFVLILGLALWVLAHFFKRLAPERRAALGDKGKGLVALVLAVSVVLMVLGYRAAPVIPVYAPFPGAGHLNNLLMVVAVLLFGAGSPGSWLSTRMRHPMLISVKVWAIAHLLVNGDLASLILFGGLLAWAVGEVILINRNAPAWQRDPDSKPGPRDARLVAVWAVMFVVIAGVHIWLGHNPFMGTY